MVIARMLYDSMFVFFALLIIWITPSGNELKERVAGTFRNCVGRLMCVSTIERTAGPTTLVTRWATIGPAKQTERSTASRAT